MVPDTAGSRDLDVHRARPVAGFAVYAGGHVSLDSEDSEEVEGAENRAVGTGVFAEGALHKEGEQRHQAENNQAREGDFVAVEIEEGKVRIVVGEYQNAGDRRQLDNPGEDQIA